MLFDGRYLTVFSKFLFSFILLLSITEAILMNNNNERPRIALYALVIKTAAPLARTGTGLRSRYNNHALYIVGNPTTNPLPYEREGAMAKC